MRHARKGMAVLLLLIAGCAAESVTLVNDKGERWNCSKAMGGGLTDADRTRDFERCLSAASMQGFRQVDR